MNENFIYVFEKTGTIAPESLSENDLWIDIGNTVKNGVFDHHQDGGCSSTFECNFTEDDLKKKYRELTCQALPSG